MSTKTPRKQKPSTNYWCVVPGCTSDSRKRKNPEKYPWMNGIEFIPFPTKKKNPKLRQKWVEMIRRPYDYEPLPHHRVCSRHFTDNNNVPELFQWNNYKNFTPKRSTASIEKREADSNAKTVAMGVATVTDCERHGEQTELSMLVEGLCIAMFSNRKVSVFSKLCLKFLMMIKNKIKKKSPCSII